MPENVARIYKEMMMKDYIVRGTAAKGQIRAFAITSRQMVEDARVAHNTSPIATAALGRLLSAGAMMGSMMKSEADVLTIQVRGDGPIGGITVTANAKAEVKGYVENPGVMLPPSPLGKLDVGGAVGKGILNVIKDLGLKEPYSGQISLQTGEIADDLTYYFASSEQVPSAVGLGVLMEKDNTVKQAGGFIIQLMPDAVEETIAKLEENIASMSTVTTYLDKGYSPEKMLEEILSGLGFEVLDTMPCKFYCNCDKDRVAKVLMTIGKKEIQNLIDEGEEIELKCHFCNSDYHFSVEELGEILELAR